MIALGTPKNYCEVSYQELERVIKDFYGVEYEIPSGEELSNDISVTMDVSSIEEINEYARDSLDTWKESNEGGFILRLIMQDMVNLEHIPKAVYLVEICW